MTNSEETDKFRTDRDGTDGEQQKKEDLLDLVKGDGLWQRKIFAVIFICAIPIATHNLCMSFYAPNLDHWCARPAHTNLTVEEWKLVGLPKEDPRCSRYKELNTSILMGNNSTLPSNIEIEACDSWEYDDSTYVSTVLSEWDLVCDREWFISLSKSIFIAGFFCTVLVSGYLADRFGRRPVIAICNFIGVVSAIICLFSVSFLMFAICRFFVAVGIAGTFNTSFVLLMEVIGPEYRSWYGVCVNFGWCLGYITLPAIVWMLKDWFWIQVVITLPCVFLLSSWWLLPESPRWLISHGRVNDAIGVLTKAGKANGVDVTELGASVRAVARKTNKESEDADTANASFLQLFARGLWQKTVVVFYLWCLISFVYFGISFNTNELAGDPFLNFALYGAIEVPANILTYFIIKSKGRRIPLAVSLGAGGAACLLMYPIPDDPWWIGVTLSLFGKFCITIAFTIVYVFTAEIFPTVVRNVGVGSSSMMARVGSIVAPFVRELGYATHPVVPQVVFGVLAATGSFLVLLLPETNNQSVPDTVEEAAERSRK